MYEKIELIFPVSDRKATYNYNKTRNDKTVARL